MNLAGLGSLLAPAELVEQQVIRGHDGGRSVDGECVYDLRERVAQRLRHVGQNGRVEILWTQPGKQQERKTMLQRVKQSEMFGEQSEQKLKDSGLMIFRTEPEQLLLHSETYYCQEEPYMITFPLCVK